MTLFCQVSVTLVSPLLEIWAFAMLENCSNRGQIVANMYQLPQHDGRWHPWQIVAWLKLWAIFFYFVAINMVFTTQ
jgi:hypothetical protein